MTWDPLSGLKLRVRHSFAKVALNDMHIVTWILKSSFKSIEGIKKKEHRPHSMFLLHKPHRWPWYDLLKQTIEKYIVIS